MYWRNPAGVQKAPGVFCQVLHRRAHARFSVVSYLVWCTAEFFFLILFIFIWKVDVQIEKVFHSLIYSPNDCTSRAEPIQRQEGASLQHLSSWGFGLPLTVPHQYCFSKGAFHKSNLQLQFLANGCIVNIFFFFLNLLTTFENFKAAQERLLKKGFIENII